jgi:hypothetical protein
MPAWHTYRLSNYCNRLITETTATGSAEVGVLLLLILKVTGLLKTQVTNIHHVFSPAVLTACVTVTNNTLLN